MTWHINFHTRISLFSFQQDDEADELTTAPGDSFTVTRCFEECLSFSFIFGNTIFFSLPWFLLIWTLHFIGTQAVLETSVSVQLGLIFSHTERYPDEPPLLNVRRYGNPVHNTAN